MQPEPTDTELCEEYDFRLEMIEEAKSLARCAGYPPNSRLLALCDKFVQGDLPLDEFRREIVRPYLH